MSLASAWSLTATCRLIQEVYGTLSLHNSALQVNDTVFKNSSENEVDISGGHLGVACDKLCMCVLRRLVDNTKALWLAVAYSSSSTQQRAEL